MKFKRAMWTTYVLTGLLFSVPLAAILSWVFTGENHVPAEPGWRLFVFVFLLWLVSLYPFFKWMPQSWREPR